MGTSSYAKFDNHVSRHDFDSQDWCDGLGHDLAVECLSNFQDTDWKILHDEWSKKDRLWRGCLATCLNPHMGEQAQDILISMIGDPDSEIAFLALNSTAFYCGINANSDGPFVDSEILHKDFFDRVKDNTALKRQIESISSECATFFSEQFTLLKKVIS